MASESTLQKWLDTARQLSVQSGYFLVWTSLWWLVLSTCAQGGQFQGTITPYGKERCIALNRFSKESGARYLSEDEAKESKLCAIAFDDKGIGLCPKTWSTSPGTIVYDIRKSKYYRNSDAFEVEYCPKQRALKGKVEGVNKLASYKQSVNGQFGQSTSATYAQASPLYYHFARYLNTTVDVPVAVMRTMDAQAHLRRVASKGPSVAQGKMNLAGWRVVTLAERDPSGYIPANEFYYGDPKDGLLYGTMLKGPGIRYGAEFNGNISGKGYSQQYVYLQRTPAFVALTSPKDFSDAMAVGVSEAKKDPIVAKALAGNVSEEQMMFWMKELSEICILDYIFSQQDRPGNVDYLWVWYYVDKQGELKSIRVDSETSRLGIRSIQIPDEVKGGSRSYLIQKTQINDNDAGGRRYANFTKKFELLSKLRHLNATTYRQLILLARDFQQKGPLYGYLRETFYLPDSYTALIAENTIQAAQVLQATCESGTMKFDLDVESYLLKKKVEEVQMNCTHP